MAVQRAMAAWAVGLMASYMDKTACSSCRPGPDAHGTRYEGYEGVVVAGFRNGKIAVKHSFRNRRTK